MIKPLPSTTIWGDLKSAIPPSISFLRMGLSISTFISSNRHVPRLAFSPKSVEFPIKSDQEDQKSMSMDAFVSKSCPSLYQTYDPPRWMHKYVYEFVSERATTNRVSLSGHVQTAYCVVGDFTKIDRVVYHRQVRHRNKFLAGPDVHSQENFADS